MAKPTASFVLILLVVAIMNGYSVEGAEKSNKLKKGAPNMDPYF